MATLDKAGAASDVDFRLVYQPIVHVDTGTVAGVEALCRFADGRAPEHWFKECERLGSAPALDLAIIERALADLSQLPTGYLSVNLSPSTLRDPRLTDLLLSPDVPADRIVVEVTEHARVADYLEAQRVLGALRKAGVRVAVDDAGAGYASLRHVVELRPDFIKIDRDLVHGLAEDHARRVAVSAFVLLSLDLNASVIAEGLERPADLAALYDLGVDAAQGYLLGRPSTRPTDLAAWLRRDGAAKAPTLGE